MSDRCIFCGTELGAFQRKKLFCGNSPQILCKDCYPKYSPLSAVERAEAALKTQRTNNPEELKAFLEQVYSARQADEAERMEKINRKITNLNCLRCNGQMLDHGPTTFKLGKETYFFSDINRLITGSVTMHVFRCQKCGKLEFFAFDEEEFDDQLEE